MHIPYLKSDQREIFNYSAGILTLPSSGASWCTKKYIMVRIGTFTPRCYLKVHHEHHGVLSGLVPIRTSSIRNPIRKIHLGTNWDTLTNTPTIQWYTQWIFKLCWKYNMYISISAWASGVTFGDNRAVAKRDITTQSNRGRRKGKDSLPGLGGLG